VSTAVAPFVSSDEAAEGSSVEVGPDDDDVAEPDVVWAAPFAPVLLHPASAHTTNAAAMILGTTAE
jgi:hypothetical protein